MPNPINIYPKLTGSLVVALLMLAMGCDPSSSSSEDQEGSMSWRLFRGNAALSGYSSQKLPEKPELLWTYKGETRTSSSPVVDEGVTYWSDNKGRIRGVGLDGQLRFDYDLKTAVEATPMIHDSVMYIGRIDGFMTAISLSQKDTLWNYETLGQISASPNLANFKGKQVVVFGSYDNYFYCLDSRNGDEISRFESAYYINGAAALWEKNVLFGGCDAWLRMIDCETGKAADSLLLSEYSYIPSSPAIMGDFCYVGDYSGNIYELLLEGGKISSHKILKTAESENSSFVSVPALSPESLYFLSDDRYLVSVDRKNGAVNWKSLLKGRTGESSPLVSGDKIIVCTKNGIVTIHDAQSGSPLWEFDTGEPIMGCPAVIKNHFFILTTKGTLFCFGTDQQDIS